MKAATMRFATVRRMLLVSFSFAFLSPDSALSQPPPQSGYSGVVRFNDFVGFFVYDAQRGLLSIHSTSTPFADICAGAAPVVDFLDIQLIPAASGLHAIFQGDGHNVLIYPAVPFDCSFLSNAPVIAAGTARIVRTDNDLLGSGQPGVNAFGWQAEGILVDQATGADVSYTEIARLQATISDVIERVINIRLH